MSMLARFASSGGDAPAFLEDVFSSYVYSGTGVTQTITNGIDLLGKGGLVWTKRRGGATANSHLLIDTARGQDNGLSTDQSSGQTSGWYPNFFTGFTSTGYGIAGNAGENNASGAPYVSWTLRKQPNFFDVVTYTGNGSNRTIAHSLRSVPGCIIVRRTDTNGNWQVYHRSNANTEYMVLNSTAVKATGATRWNSTTPTATEFSLGTDANVNANGGTYVAYLFAHDAGGFGVSGNDNAISCGSHVTSASASTWTSVNLGYEPQWILIKNTTTSGNWQLVDVIRRLDATGTSNSLFPSDPAAEQAYANAVRITSTGFEINSGFLGTSQTLIYVAIRRPNKPPTTGTSVFSPVTQSLSGGSVVTTGFVTDMGLNKILSSGNPLIEARLTSSEYLETNTTSSVGSGSTSWVYMNGYGPTPWTSGSAVIYGFRRAPGFFDVVCYTGTGSARTVSHNLGVEPGLMIVKARSGTSGTGNWQVYYGQAGEYIVLNTGNTNVTSNTDRWNNTSPTSSVFSLGTSTTVNGTSTDYIAYLFATVPAVSKVGTYTGNGGTVNTNGTAQTINCGFITGARFVLIKRTDSGGNWHVFDSARGIVAGSDPYFLLNSTAAEVTTVDAVDADNSGFIVNQTTTENLNVTGATYIYLSIS